LATSIGKAARPNRDALQFGLASLAVLREEKLKVTFLAFEAVNQNEVFSTFLRTPGDSTEKSVGAVGAVIIVAVDADRLVARAAKNTDLCVVVEQGAAG
jgi:hypothetical protein